MATVKYGTVVTELKGSAGGTTFKSNGSGFSMQNKINSNPTAKKGGKLTKADASRVINAQLNQTQSIQAWRALTAGERSSWEAGAVNFPFVNRFGEQYTGSGYQLFISVNNNLQAVGEPILTTCPAPGAIDPAPSFTVAYVGGGTPALNVSGSNISGYSQILFATAQQSLGRNFETGRLKGIRVLPDTTAFPLNVIANYQSLFGTMPASGNVWFEMRIVHVASGRQGASYRFQLEY